MNRLSVNVLLIEDNPGDANLIRIMLKDAQSHFSMQMTHAEKLKKGIQLLKETDTHAILLDLSLPDSKGINTFLELYNRVPDIPILVLTGLDDATVGVKAVQEGAQDYLIKGQINSQLLAHAIRYAIERHQLVRELQQKTQALEMAKAELEERVAERTAELRQANEAIQLELAERKRTDAALKASQERYRSAIEAGLDAFYLLESVRDEDGEIIDFQIVEVNENAVQQMSLPRKTLVGCLICEMFPVNRTNGFFDQYKQVAETGQPFEQEYSIPTEHAAPGWYHQQVVKVGDGVAISNRNITERKKAENDVARQARELAALYETSLEINARPELNTVLNAIVSRAISLIGIDGGGSLSLIQPDQKTLTLAAYLNYPGDPHVETIPVGLGLIGRTAQSGKPLVVDDYSLWEFRTNEPGANQIRRAVSVPMVLEEEVIGVISVFDTKKPGAFSKESVRLLELFAAQAGIAIQNARLLQAERSARKQAVTLRDATKTLVAALNLKEVLNEILTQLAKVTNYDSASIFLLQDNRLRIVACRGFAKPEEIIGLTVEMEANQLFQEVARTKQPLLLPNAVDDLRYQQLGDSESVRGWMGVPLLVYDDVIGHLTIDSRQADAYSEADANMAQAFANQAAVAIHNARLHTELQEAQTQLIERERLAALGQMAATLAHELRNPLMGLRMGTDYMLADVPESDPRWQGASLMQSNMDRIDNIVEDILYVARSPKPRLRPESLQTLIEEEANRWYLAMKEREIRFHLQLDDGLSFVPIDPGQISRALSNLIANSVDVIPAGGELKLSLTQVNGRQQIALSDNGSGISPAHLPHIFEPFFTTKSRGTGLGLSIVKQIIEYHNGEIDVISQPGMGTTFTITLPTIKS